MSISDSDMPGWIQSLREAGFADKETDMMLARLNEMYSEQKGIVNVEKELKKIENELREKHGKC